MKDLRNALKYHPVNIKFAPLYSEVREDAKVIMKNWMQLEAIYELMLPHNKLARIIISSRYDTNRMQLFNKFLLPLTRVAHYWNK